LEGQNGSVKFCPSPKPLPWVVLHIEKVTGLIYNIFVQSSPLAKFTQMTSSQQSCSENRSVFTILEALL